MTISRLAAETAMAISLVSILAACSSTSEAPSLTGSWNASDGTPTKVIQASGECTGMYYSNGQPLDIGGGGMTCTMASTMTNGRYPLTVQQAMNSETLYVTFGSSSQATVFDGSGKQLFTMTKK